ncbi:MAG TPA: DUF4058 domain-containing protein [Gemmataceae bacterium]|nr:DUF4058 domain-containing protein [Gemmataceae bacterium]
MPLQDHFHPPLSLLRHWHAFYNSWATYLSADLNRRLPPSHFAEANVQFAVEIDILEVLVYGEEDEPALTGVVKFVSPPNKDQPARRYSYVSKCAAYVQQGVGLIVVDIVSDRSGNLHGELLARLQAPELPPVGADLYAVAYRPVSGDAEPRLEIWSAALAIGQPLPTLPLWLRGGPCLPVELEATYERTRQEQRVGLNGA